MYGGQRLFEPAERHDAMRTAALVCSLITICAISTAFAQDSTSVLPPGYTLQSFESGWLGPGNNPPDVCAGLVRQQFPNQRYQIMSVGENQRFRIPELRIDSLYQYRCSVLIAPN